MKKAKEAAANIIVEYGLELMSLHGQINLKQGAVLCQNSQNSDFLKEILESFYLVNVS